MPRYEYRCDHCNKTVEEIRPIADMNVVKRCYRMDCGGMLQKVLTLGRVLGQKNVPNN